MSFDTEKFIQEMQNRPCLWNTSVSEYTNRSLKKRCWYELADIFKIKEDMKLQEKRELVYALQKKWKNIRGCYTRELKRRKSMKAGSTNEPRKSEYIFFKQLQFLQRVVSVRDADLLTGSADDSTTNSEDEDSKVRLQVDRRKRQKITTSTENENYIEFITEPVESREKAEISNDDEDRLFLLSLVETLKRVPQHRKMATKIKIMSVLDEETSAFCNY